MNYENFVITNSYISYTVQWICEWTNIVAVGVS